jgi:hypothetical protein
MSRYERIKYAALVIFVAFPLAALLDLLSRLSERGIERRAAHPGRSER